MELPGGSKITESSRLELNPNFQPRFYERKQKSPHEGSLTAEFSPEETTLVTQTEEGSQEQIFLLPTDHLVVLDTNFFHHYSFLLRQYVTSQAASQPSSQTINVFIPQEALPGTVSLLSKGREKETVGKEVLELNHFQVVSDELTIDIWATEKSEIQRISIPQANLEIVRQK